MWALIIGFYRNLSRFFRARVRFNYMCNIFYTSKLLRCTRPDEL